MRYRLTGEYGTFTISKIVDAQNDETAQELTGIVTDLEAAGWTIIESPDGEEWTVQAIDEDGEPIETWDDEDGQARPLIDCNCGELVDPTDPGAGSRHRNCRYLP